MGWGLPLLVAGRLGDRFGPKNIYLIGLAVFTAASLWCGLSGSIAVLVTARVVEGIGAGLLTPQTLSVITRTFPAERRGVATSVWGAALGVATLAGPLVGGVLIDQLGWQCIFFVNVPIGIIGFGLAVWLIPTFATNRRRFDLVGVVLFGSALFLIVFALQEAQPNHWAPWIWAMLAGGLIMMAAFVYWQFVNKSEPLIPLRVFKDRNFSVSSLGVAVIAFVWTAMVLPVMFFAQVACGLSAARAALLTAPMALTTAVLVPVAGRIVDRSHPRRVIGFGFAVLAVSLAWLSIEMTAVTPVWRLLLPFTGLGVGIAFITSAADGHRHAQSAARAGWGGLRCVQRHSSDGFGVGQRHHGCVHDMATEPAHAPGFRRRHLWPWRCGRTWRAINFSARSIRGGDVSPDAAGGVCGAVGCGGRAVSDPIPTAPTHHRERFHRLA